MVPGLGALQGAARRARQPGRRDVGAAAGRASRTQPSACARSRRDGGPEESGQAVGAQVLTNLAGFAPPTILSQAARLQARQRFFNLVVTNVPGPQFPLYLLGRRLRGLYPVRAARPAPGARDRGDELRRPSRLRAARRLRRRCPSSTTIASDLQMGDRGARDGRGPARCDRRSAARAASAKPRAKRLRRDRGPPARARLRPARPSPADEQAHAVMRLALCQINADRRRHRRQRRARSPRRSRARATAGAELVLFPELALTGYPPEDLLLQGALPRRRARGARASSPREATGHRRDRRLPRARRGRLQRRRGARRRRGRTRSTARSTCPTTASSTSSATSRPGSGGAVDRRRRRSAIGADRLRGHLGARPARLATRRWPARRLIVNISASPYHAGKGAERERMFAQRARDNLACVAFCGLVGGQDELVFDGHSCVVDHTGTTIARAAQFEEELLRLRRRPRAPPRRRACATPATAPPRGAASDGVERAAGAARRRRPAAGAPAPLPAALAAAARARRGGGLRGAGARPARLRREERLRARRARPLRRHRLGARRLPRRRRARGRARQRRDHALPLLLARRPSSDARGPRARRSASRLIELPIARVMERLRGRCSRTPSTGTRAPTSPRRTCRRASAATC